MQKVRIPAIKLATCLTAIILLMSSLIFSGCMNRPRPPEHLRILFTSDTQGMFTPCGCVGGPRGGLAARSTAIRQARESAPGPVILLDTGNFTSGFTSATELAKAEFVANAMDYIGYDAVNVGKRDARRPRDGVQSLEREGCPLTSAGFTYTDEATGERDFSYPPRKIIDINGYKIAVIGSPLAELNKDDLGLNNVPDVPVMEMQDLMDLVNSRDNPGMIIVISDLTDTWEISGIAASNFPLASLVIAGQSAPAAFKETKSGDEIKYHPILIPRAESWGRAVGVLDLELSPRSGIISYNLSYIDLDDTIEKDPKFAEMDAAYSAKMEDLGSKVVPKVSEAGYVGHRACKDCHGGQYESWEKSRHSKAWDTLQNSATTIDSTCTPCHATGYDGYDQVPQRLVPYEFQNVGCESCHGPGQVHAQYQEWKIYGSLTGDPRGEGTEDPIVLNPPRATCEQCHVPPHDEGWNYFNKIERVHH